VYDFETPGKNVEQLLDYAQQAGLWVIARPGPYCNAETNGGGLALWGSDGSLGNLRTSDETYHEAWLPWVQQIGAILAANQITNGGVRISLAVVCLFCGRTDAVPYTSSLSS
jgi:beta-galactosidase GanA